MADLKRFDYEGHKISFEFEDGNKMINATHMAKAFKKLVGHFLALKGTKDYISLLNSRYRDSDNGTNKEVLRVVQGGNPELQGTWMDEKLALKFAAWLSPAFELWVYDKIEELLTTGATTLESYEPSVNIQTLRLLIDQMEKQEIQAQKIKQNLQKHDQRIGKNSIKIKDLEAKIISIDENYYSVSGYCALNAVLCPQQQAQKWGLAATKLSQKSNTPIGKAYDAKFGEVNTYHQDILKQVVLS